MTEAPRKTVSADLYPDQSRTRRRGCLEGTSLYNFEVHRTSEKLCLKVTHAGTRVEHIRLSWSKVGKGLKQREGGGCTGNKDNSRFELSRSHVKLMKRIGAVLHSHRRFLSQQYFALMITSHTTAPASTSLSPLEEPVPSHSLPFMLSLTSSMAATGSRRTRQQKSGGGRARLWAVSCRNNMCPGIPSSSKVGALHFPGQQFSPEKGH